MDRTRIPSRRVRPTPAREPSLPPTEPFLDPSLRIPLTALFREGRELWERFDVDVRRREWHPFVPGNYEGILEAVLAHRGPLPAGKFLEWGSGMGVVTIMADLLGFEAYGIELDADLVRVARELAARHGSGARFVHGSFLPADYRWRSLSGDERTGTIGAGESAYPELGWVLEDFALVFAYPWDGEEPLMRDLMERHGNRGGSLLVQGSEGEVTSVPMRIPSGRSGSTPTRPGMPSP